MRSLLPLFAAACAAQSSPTPATVGSCDDAAAHVAACGGATEVVPIAGCDATLASHILATECSELATGDKGVRELLGWDTSHTYTCDSGSTLSFITTNFEEAQVAVVGRHLCRSLAELDRALERIGRARDGSSSERDKLRVWFGRDQLAYEELDIDRIESVVRATRDGLMAGSTAFSAIETSWWDMFSLIENPCARSGTVAVNPHGSDRIGLCPVAWESNELNWLTVIIHEATHAYGGTVDHGYMGPCAYHLPSFVGGFVTGPLAASQLLENADTYTGWITNRAFLNLTADDGCEPR